jgi:chromosome segregation ATPase
MKRISILLTILFLLLMVVPSFADDYYQGNSDYDKAMREIEEYNANVSREYEKQMREYERKLRANRSLLRRVEQQYPEIRARATASEPDKDLQESPTQEAASPQTVPTVKSSTRTNSADSPRIQRLKRAKARQRSFTTRHIFKSQSVSQGQNSSQNTNFRNPSNLDQEQKKREYERQVKAYEAKQKEVEQRNAELRKEYERQKAEVDKYNAEVRRRNDEIQQYNAEQDARAKAQLDRSKVDRFSDRKPYLEGYPSDHPRARQKYARPPHPRQ